MANVGYVALLLALVISIYAAVAALVGARRRTPELVMSARNAALAVTGLLTLAVVILEVLLISGDYRTLYVAEVSNQAMPVFFKMTALWGSQGGGLATQMGQYAHAYALRHRGDPGYTSILHWFDFGRVDASRRATRSFGVERRGRVVR